VAVSLDVLATQLIEAGLVTLVELSALRDKHQPADSEALARLLVKQKALTAYQAQQAYAGKAKALVLGNYVVLDKLGQGGMGMVLKARHKRMNRLVALKVLSPAVVKTADAMKRFQREVEAAAKLHHPNIVAAHDADEVNGTHFLVMEYVEGTDLSVLVKTKGPLSIDQAVKCVLQAARGLEFAHAHGVIHRDIKPANLLLDKHGTVKVLDMGLARIEGETGSQAELTSTGAVMGTVDYMAPEQALSTKSADARSDIYSLGISLWYLLTARPVYEGDSLMARLLAHRETPPPSLKGVRSEVPAALDSLFQKMIAKQPKDRCQTMTEIIAFLETCLQQQAVSTKSTPSFTAGPSEESKLSEFMGVFGVGTDPNAPTRSVPKQVESATLAAPSRGSEYEATVTSTKSTEGTDPATLTNLVRSTPTKPLSRQRLRLAIAASMVACVLIAGFVIFGSSTTSQSPPSSNPLPSSGTGVASSGSSSSSAPAQPSRDGALVIPSRPNSPIVAAKALRFAGVGQHVDEINPQLEVNQPWTAECWVTPGDLDIVNPESRLLFSSEVAFLAAVRTEAGDLRWWASANEAQGPQFYFSDHPIALHRRTHVALVYQENALWMFLDGQLQGTPLPVPLSPRTVGFQPLPCVYSSRPDRSNGNGFTGDIDEVRLSQVARYKAPFTPSDRFDSDPQTLLLYHFDEGQGNRLTDSSGKESHGRIVGAAWVSVPATGPSSRASQSLPPIGDFALRFASGQTTDYVELPPDVRFDDTRPGTVEMWIPAREVITGTPLFLVGDRKFLKFQFDEPNRSRLVVVPELVPQDESPMISISAPSIEFRPGPLHLAACWSGPKSCRFYVNGKKFGTARDSRSLFADYPTSTIGYKTLNGLATNLPQTFTVGQVRLSDVERYTAPFAPPRLLEADEHTQALYRLDEGEGDVIRDHSGHERHGRRYGAMWVARPDETGVFLDDNPSLAFEGPGQRVDLPPLPLTDAKSLTVEAVVRLDAPQPNQGAILRTNQISLKVQGFETFFAMGRKEQGVKSLATTHSSGIPLGRPVHLAGVWSGSRLEIYVDGQLQGWNEDGDQVLVRPGSNTIGDHTSTPQEPFFGRLYRVRISKTARYAAPFRPDLKLPTDAETVVRYGFEEGQGETLGDSSGNGLDGKIVGTKWVGAVSSEPSQSQSNTAVLMPGVELDGIDDYIDLTSDWIYDGGPVTVEMWATSGIPASDQEEAVLLRGEAPSAQAGGRLKLMYRQPSTLDDGERTGQLGFSRPPDVNVATGRHTFQPGTLTHLAAVFDGKETTIFVDGRPKRREGRTYQWGSYAGTRYLWIGALRSEQTAATGNWTGIIHKVRLSSTARYAKEFVPAADFEPDPQTEGLYRFDEGTGPVARDSSGHQRHAKIIGGSWAAPGQAPASGLVDPPPGSYLQFDGVTAFVEVPSLKFDGGKPLTLEAWVLGDSEVADNSLKTILGWGGGASLNRVAKLPWYLFYGYGPQGEEGKSEAGVASESRRLHHVAGVWDGAALRTFVDGKPGGAQPVGQLFQALRDNDALKDHFCISAAIPPEAGANRRKGEFFKGFIDEVRVSQTARYSGEFTPSRRFEPDADTLALFHFDEGSGTEVRDDSGNDHHGKVVGAKWFTTNPPASAEINGPNYELDFDGKSHVQLPQIDFTGFDGLTIEATLTPREPPKKDAKGEPTGAFISDKERFGLGLLVKERGLIFEVGTKLGDGTASHEFVSPGVPWTMGTQRVAGVIDLKVKTAAFFVNGHLIERKPIKGNFTGGPTPLMLGADPTALGTPNNFFAGRLDEVRLSKVARYTADYAPPSRLESDQNTLALYHCDEGVRDQLTDSSGNSRHGKVIGAKWVTSGANQRGGQPAAAIAPFDAAQARQHQDAWASDLGVPVEYTNSVGMKFVLIPPGEFTMGSTAAEIQTALKDLSPIDPPHWVDCIQSEAPQHKVILTQATYLSVHEVTQAQYEKVIGQNPANFSSTGMGKESVVGMKTADHPVEMVSWNDAAEFCTQLSKLEERKPFYLRAGETFTPLDGTGYRLPTEAEWEFACRAGTTTRYWIGDKEDDLLRAGWFGGNSGGRTHAAGEREANPFGLADTHGNVWEWVQDGWDASYYGQFRNKPAVDPSVPFSAGSLRVIRGGGWYFPSSRCLSSNRYADVPTFRHTPVGFRVSLTLADKGKATSPAGGSQTEAP
jgi:serine/threonine protein kinase/formylglycine-generating enzyme required for sulfatase activity